MRNGIVLFTSDRGIKPADLARAAEERGFDTIYVPEHTHIPVKRDALHPTGGEELPDDRYHAHARPVDHAGHLRRRDRADRPLDRGLPPGRVRPDHPRQDAGHPRPPLRRTGHHRRRLRMEHRRAHRPPRPGRQAAHRAQGVPRGDARAVDPGGGVVRRGVRVLRPELGLPEATAGPHPGHHRRRRRPEDHEVDRPQRRRVDDHARSRPTSPRRRTSCARSGPTPAAQGEPDVRILVAKKPTEEDFADWMARAVPRS